LQSKMDLGLKVDQKIELTEKKQKRKEHGIYYTPKFVTDYIVKETVGRFLKEKTYNEALNIKILDPACGSGSFLIRAYDELLSYHAYQRSKSVPDLGQWERLSVLTKNVFGVDMDRQAVEIARLNLLLRSLAKRETLPILGDNIREGNSLISGTEKELKAYFGAQWREKKPFNWDEEFKDIMAQGGFDVVIGNPPYVDIRTMDDDLKGYFKSNYRSAAGMFDFYVLFVERGLNLLRNGGTLGLIISNKFLASDYGQKLRELLLDEYLVEKIVDVAQLGVFKEASIYPCIMIVSKGDSTKQPGLHAFEIISNLQDNADIAKGRYSNVMVVQRSFRNLNKSIIPLQGGGENSQLIDKVVGAGVPLKTLCNVKAGIHVGNVKNKIVVSDSLNDRCKRLVSGRSMTRYAIYWDGAYVIYDPKGIESSMGEWAHFRDESIFTADEKIFVRYIGKCLSATYDDEQYYSLDTAYVVNAKSDLKYGLKYILGILNARLLTWFYATLYGSLRVRGGYLRFIGTNLESIPIRRIDFDNPKEKTLHDDLVALVDKMLDMKKRAATAQKDSTESQDFEREINRTDKEIDSLVYDLYGLTEEERKIVESGVS